jgi:ABC-type multidrug transport system fused ATPase/permease subunit
LIVAEERATGAVTVRTLAAYASAASGSKWVLLPVLVVLLLSKSSRQVSDWWMSFWTSHVGPASPLSEHRLYLGIYAAIVLGVFITSLAQGLSFVKLTLGASRVFHNRVFASVMRGTAAWFDGQPTGRILSRFTSDLDLIDNMIPPNVEQTAEVRGPGHNKAADVRLEYVCFPR